MWSLQSGMLYWSTVRTESDECINLQERWESQTTVAFLHYEQSLWKVILKQGRYGPKVNGLSSDERLSV